MNDGVNSISRFYLNNFRDSIYQLAIDYFLGKISMSDYVEKVMERSSLKEAATTSKGDINASTTSNDEDELPKLQASAIENCRLLVVRDDETFIKGWTLPCSSVVVATGTPTSWMGYKEDILILTGSAFYNCRYHYYLDKIIHFQRVPVDDISKIEKGTVSRDGMSAQGQQGNLEKQLFGMVLHFKKLPKGRVDPGTFMNRRLSSPSLFSPRQSIAGLSPDDCKNTSDGLLPPPVPKTSPTSNLQQPVMDLKQFRCWVSPNAVILDEIIKAVLEIRSGENILELKESIDWTMPTSIPENVSTLSRIQKNLRKLVTINRPRK